MDKKELSNLLFSIFLEGEVGPRGAKGNTGPAGPPGPNGM
jgi:hypothetical protein